MIKIEIVERPLNSGRSGAYDAIHNVLVPKFKALPADKAVSILTKEVENITGQKNPNVMRASISGQLHKHTGMAVRSLQANGYLVFWKRPEFKQAK